MARGIYHLLKKKKKTGNSSWKIKWLASCHAVWEASESMSLIDGEDQVIFLLILVSSPDLVKFCVVHSNVLAIAFTFTLKNKYTLGRQFKKQNTQKIKKQRKKVQKVIYFLQF